jgi:hypothetical protein
VLYGSYKEDAGEIKLNNRPSIEELFQLGVQHQYVLSPNSRYQGIQTAIFETPEGKQIIYLRRRFVPAPERFALLQEHTVVERDRLDNIAGHYLGDPELFWRLCDANRTLHPEELTAAVGNRIRITLPEGIPGNADE